MTCASCGTVNPAGMNFCGNCGAPLAARPTAPDRERKVVTVLFCDLVAFTAASDGADPEEIQARLSPYHARARLEIERFGGTVEKFIGDAVMAAFGAPIAHEDDPERAVRAGLALLDAVEELNTAQDLGLAVRVGIATGEAVVTTGARPERGEGMLAGDVVNTAARLQTSAPVGGVLVGQTTHDLTRASIEYRSLDPITVKGKAEPLPVWVAVRSRGSAGVALADTSTPMIGRIDELEMLQRAYARAERESSVQLVTIVGEPGLGKSRLVQAFADWLDKRDELVTWRQGRCLPYGDAATYAALSHVVKAQAGIADNDAADIVRSKLDEAVHVLVDKTDLAEQASWMVARLATLIGLSGSEAGQEELFTAWRRYLEAMASESPLVMVIEDLHWADQPMVDFLGHLLEWATGVPLVIVATARPELFDKVPNWGAGHRNSTILSLSPLTDTETAQLVASVLGARTLDADLHTVLLARAAGNPLFAREYLNMMGDAEATGTGDADDQPPSSARADALSASLPGSVQAVIAARIDTLQADWKQLLQAAAVVGHTFWAGAVAALTESDAAVVDSRLHDLVRRDYLRPSRTSTVAGQTEYLFSHALIADVARQQLPRDRRASYHLKAAEWYAGLAPDAGSLDAKAAVAAHHFTRAYDLKLASGADSQTVRDLATTAAGWHTRAARHAQQVDLAAADSHAQSALSLLPEGLQRQRAELLILQGDVLESTGRAADAETSFAEAHEQAQQTGDVMLAALADVHRSRVVATLARFDEASALIDGAIAALERQPANAELAAGYVAAATMLMRRGLFRDAAARARQAVELVERLDDPPPRLYADALNACGSAVVWSGDPSGTADLERALAMAKKHDFTELVIGINVALAVVNMLHETAERTIPHARTAAKLAEERGQAGNALVCNGNLAFDLAISGFIDEALDVCEHASTRLDPNDTTRDAATFWLNHAWILSLHGDLAAASTLATRALPTARRIARVNLVEALLTVIDCAEISAEPDRARADAIAELVTALDDDVNDESLTEYLPRLTRTLAAEHLSLATRIIANTSTGIPFNDNNVLAARAVAAAAAGDHEVAARLFAEAERAWAAYGHPYERAQALIGLADCNEALGRSSTEAPEPREAARAILDRIGARRLLSELG